MEVLPVKSEKNDVTFCAAMTATNRNYPPPGGTTLRPHGDGPADPARFIERSAHPDYPRTSAYDPTWVFLNHMGPNVLWLTEWLTQVLDLEPGMRVLDLGCGTAISSIFLASEFDVQVWAADLWISPDDNAKRIAETDSPTACSPSPSKRTRSPSPPASSTRS